MTKELFEDYLTRFKGLPDLTLAKKIYKEHSESYINLEAVRSKVRIFRGKKVQNGKGFRSDKTFFEPKTGHINPFNLPESYAEDFTPFQISQSKTLIISDTHFPYQHNNAITLALNYGLKHEANCILINGDLIDFATISRHEKNWKQRSVNQEFEAVRQFLFGLREAFPKARIIWKYGNHCERWEKWLYVKAPEIFDCTDFKLEVLLKLGELKIEVVKDKRPIKIGKLTVLHGHELGGSGGVNVARGAFLKTLDSVTLGHFHKTSEHTEVRMGGDVISVKSIGCLCGLNPDYMPINKWNLGFAFCEMDIKAGDYELDNLKIINGKIFK